MGRRAVPPGPELLQAGVYKPCNLLESAHCVPLVCKRLINDSNKYLKYCRPSARTPIPIGITLATLKVVNIALTAAVDASHSMF